MKYKPQLNFSAQAFSFKAMQCLFSRLNHKDMDEYDYVPIVVFAAFSIEAYINSVGSRKIIFWDQIERLPWKQKVEILHANLGVTANWEEMPLKFAREVFSFRNRLAHGKPETIDGPICNTQGEAKSILMVQYLKPKWCYVLKKDWILESNDQLCDVLNYLGNLYGFDKDDFKRHSRGQIIESEP